MQLPRGTFLKIKKKQLVGSILDELEHTKFTGTCSVSSGPVSGTLVFKSGTCILSKIHHKTGNGAWEEIQTIRDHEADAALSSLDEAQIQLALEFNKTCRVVNAGKTTTATNLPPQKPSMGARYEPAEKTPQPTRIIIPVKPEASLHKHAAVTPPARGVVSPRPSAIVTPSEKNPSFPITAKKSPLPASAVPRVRILPSEEQEKPAGTDEAPEESSSFEKDIDTFDSLDIENMTDKIRDDCKTMIKQLQLEHLMER